MTFTVFIPTYNRAEDLARCLGSLLVQSLLPTEVLVIDDATLDEAYLAEWRAIFAKNGVAFSYYRKDHATERRGLAESKNRALQLVTTPIFFVLDDDVVLERDYCERIMAVWEGRDCFAALAMTVGVGGVIKNRRTRTAFERAFHRFFGLSSKLAWDINDVGYQVWDEDVIERSVGYYAHGGVCSYDLAKARELGFTAFSGGRTGLEDVDFCARAKLRGWHFIIEPKAQLYHYPKPVGREGEYLSGRKESENRLKIFTTLNPRPTIGRRVWFAWASAGWILRQLLTRHWRKAWGMIIGFLA
jgi:glycosyltransferase involved in cell wall biosynthesis